MATLKYLADRTSIPVPSVLAFNRGSDGEQSTTCYALLQKVCGSDLTLTIRWLSGLQQPSGICVESVFHSMTPFEQNSIVAALARWMVEIFKHRFEAIGSLRTEESNGFRIGPVAMKPFYADGRSKLSLDRGPFTSARAYYRACAQRELDSSRMLFVQDAPESYQQGLEESRLTVERITGLLCDLTDRCEGLDDDDPDMAPFSLDIHEIGLKNIFVSPENPTNIVSSPR